MNTTRSVPLFPEFRRGMGFGGWLTNYKRFNVLPQARRTRPPSGASRGSTGSPRRA